MDTTNMDPTTPESTNPEATNKDSNKRPTVVTIAAILLIVLCLFVAGLGVANQFGLLGQGFGGRQFAGRIGQNRTFNPQGGFPQGGFPQGGFQNDPNNPGTTPNRTFNRPAVTGFARIFQILRPITLALDIILFVLAVVAAIGLFKSKRWGTIMAIVISVLLILLTVPSMIRIFSTVTLAENLVRILLAVAVIVLLLLPSARKSYATPEVDEQVEVERIVR
jgi:magnesium-transporting ATPase (P-type)